jgi:hypothetical protein
MRFALLLIDEYLCNRFRSSGSFLEEVLKEIGKRMWQTSKQHVACRAHHVLKAAFLRK